MASFFNQVERVWYLKKVSGSNAQTPIGLLKRKYYTAYSGVLAAGENAPQLSLGELEWRWLLKYVSGHGGTVSDDDGSADLWIKMVATTGKVPTKYVNQNQIIFYQNAA